MKNTFKETNTIVHSGILPILFAVLAMTHSNCEQSSGPEAGTKDLVQTASDTSLPLRERVLPLIALARIDEALKLMTANGQSAAKPLRLAWETANEQFMKTGTIDYEEWARVQNRTISGLQTMLEPLAAPTEKVPRKEVEKMIDAGQFEEAFTRLEKAGYEEAYLQHGRYANLERAYLDKKVNDKLYQRERQRIGFAVLDLVRE